LENLDNPKNEEKNLDEIRLSKRAESLKLVEEKTFEQDKEASDFVIENLEQNSIIILEKVTETSFRIRKFEVFYKVDS